MEEPKLTVTISNQDGGVLECVEVGVVIDPKSKILVYPSDLHYAVEAIKTAAIKTRSDSTLSGDDTAGTPDHNRRV